MSWNFTTSGSAIKRAGAYADTNITIDNTTLTRWSDQAEGFIVASTRKNYISVSSSIATPIYNTIAETVDALIARKIINYNPTGYGLAVAQTTQDILVDDIKTNIKILSDFKTEDLQTPS